MTEKEKQQKIGKPAIYKITNSINNKIYIGSCVGHYLRKGQHWYRLRKGTHDNKHMQSAWNLYGEEAFSFKVIEWCNKKTLIEREQHYINTLNVCDRTIGYNKAKIAGSQLGHVMSKESRKKMSIAKTGIKQCPKAIEVRAILIRKPVIQYDKKGNKIAEFSCIREAGEYINIDRGSISKAISKKYPYNKTAGGYYWKFKT